MKRIFGILFLVLVAICATAEDAKAQSVEKKCVELASRSMSRVFIFWLLSFCLKQQLRRRYESGAYIWRPIPRRG